MAKTPPPAGDPQALAPPRGGGPNPSGGGGPVANIECCSFANVKQQAIPRTGGEGISLGICSCHLWPWLLLKSPSANVCMTTKARSLTIPNCVTLLSMTLHDQLVQSQKVNAPHTKQTRRKWHGSRVDERNGDSKYLLCNVCASSSGHHAAVTAMEVLQRGASET